MAAFSLKEYCASLEAADLTVLHESSQQFVQSLGLPTVHPFCANATMEFPENGVPAMGPLIHNDHHESMLDAIVTVAFQAAPALLAMGELWLRLFASALAPLGICFLLWDEMTDNNIHTSPSKQGRRFLLAVVASCLLSVASSVVLMTDTYYVFEYGPRYGATLLAVGSVLSFRAIHRHGIPRQLNFAILALLLIAFYLVSYPPQFGGPHVPRIDQGLYYSSDNPVMKSIAQHWPVNSRTYSVENGATPWMPTGDSRTGLPFLLNHWHNPNWSRFYVETTNEEVIALDICFPPTGHDPNKPVYLIFHGLNGGSREGYIQDLVHRRTMEGHTMIVMIARGLMDLPVRGWNVFHGARTDDVTVAAKTVRQGLAPNQLLVGVGYSMGAIVLSNYVARSGKDCALDAAMAVSGGLDLRFNLNESRAQRVWQPLLVTDLRQEFILGKFGERYKHRLTNAQLLHLLRAYSIQDVDEQAVVTYNGFNDVEHYYSEMSALGDVPRGVQESDSTEDAYSRSRISNVSIPFCVMHSLDDPLISWRTVASKSGMMNPETLATTGSGHLMILLTKAGGHVGWPVGWFPHLHKWRWMSDAVKGFVDATALAGKDFK